jgi:hypothetical protein
MPFLFETPSWILSSLLIVIPTVIVSLFVLWLLRKWHPAESLRENHDVAGFTLGIIGVLYSVVLGFTVVNAQARYNDVVQTIHTEAITLADLYRDAAFFPPQSRDAIRSSLRQYVNYVLEKEWWMPAEKKIRIETQDIMEKVYTSYYAVPLINEKVSIWYTESISKLNAFMNARLSRQFNSWEHLGAMMWTLLLVGGVITVAFMFFFGLALRPHMIMTALLAGYISFMLYLVYSLDNVFKGPEGIKPIALEQVISLFDRWDTN